MTQISTNSTSNNLHPVLGWLLFLPAGILAIWLLSGALRVLALINHMGEFWTSWMDSVGEPWAFLAVSLALIPRGHRALILTFTTLFCGLAIVSTIRGFMSPGISAHPWADLIIALFGILSAGIAAWVFHESYRPVSTLPNDA